MAGKRLVVGEGELHPAHDGVKALGLGTAELLVHEVGVVDYLGYLTEHRVLQLVLLQERLERAVFAAVGEPCPHDVEELRSVRGLRGVAEEGEGGFRVYEAPYQPDTGGAVYMAASAGSPQHQLPPPEPSAPAEPSLPLTASRAALSAAAASFLSGERK